MKKWIGGERCWEQKMKKLPQRGCTGEKNGDKTEEIELDTRDGDVEKNSGKRQK